MVDNQSSSRRLDALFREFDNLAAENRLALEDRKSTRLNSSHGYISYAVFCLKKKTVDILNRFNLADVMGERTATLPYGKQRLLQIALAIACRPHVLLLDEPSACVPEAERHGI